MTLSNAPSKESPDIREIKLKHDLIVEENRQLKEELELVKKQYHDTVNFVPNMTKFYNENNDLKRQNSELKNANDDLTKRLKIAMQTNEDLKNEKLKSKNEASRVYVDEIAELQSKLSSLSSDNEKNSTRYQEQIKDLELANHNFQSDVSSLQNQISKVLKLSGGYFNTIFKTTDELIEYLKQGSNLNSNSSSNESQKNNQSQNENEEKMQTLKNKLQKEKQKRNELNLNFLKLSKKLEHDKLLYEEQMQQLNDHIRQQANEIQRLELLNQQKQIPELNNNIIQQINPYNKVKLRNTSCQVSLVEMAENSEIDELKRQLLTLNSQLSDQQNDYSTIKMKYDELKKQMSDSESSRAQAVEKLKWTNEQLSECQSNLIIQKKELETLKLVNHELKEELNQKETENVLPQTELESKLKFLEVENKNSQKALKNLEILFGEQKKEIFDLTSNKEKLIMIIEKQNILLNGMNEIIYSKRSNQSKKSYDIDSLFNDNENTEQSVANIDQKKSSDKVMTVEPKFKWAIGQLPDDINDIVREFAENDSLSIESRIKNIFFVINKWIEQKDITTQKEISNITTEKAEVEKKYEQFKSDVISACETDNDTITQNSFNNEIDEDNTITESNVPAFIKNIISQRIDYHRELIQLKDQYKRLLDMEKYDNIESLIEDNRKTKEINIRIIEKLDQEHKKRLAMKKQFKEYVTLKEKDYSEKMELNRKSKESSRKLIEKKQNTIDQLQAQINSLMDKIKEIPELRRKQIEEDEKNRKISIIDEDSYVQSSSSSKDINMNEVAHQSKIEFENEELKVQINSLNKSVESWKEAVKEAHDENALLQQKIEKMKEDYESKISQISKKSESQNDEHNETVQSLSEKLKKLTEDHKIQLEKLNEKLIDSHQKYDKVAMELSHLQFEKERMNHSNNMKIEAIERSRKLSEAQLKAQMMSIDSKYAIIIEEERQKSEQSKRELIEYFICAFRTFSNVDQQLNEEAFHDVVRKVKSQLEKCEKMEMSIRKLIKAGDDEPIEDALTQFIIKYHPQFQAK